MPERTAATASIHRAELPRRTDLPASAPERRGGVLLAVCLAALVLPLSFSGGAVATPAIGRELGGSPAALSWITNAFMLSFGGCLMAAGALADELGRKRVFTTGVGAFAAISFGVSLAPSLLWLDVLRAAQGVAAAAALAGGSAALAQELDGPARTRAFSWLGATFGAGLAFGPLLAGLVVETLGWRAVFRSTTVVGVLALWLAARRMRESRDPAASGLDRPGALAFTAALTAFTFAIIDGPRAGWSSPLVVALFAGAAAALAAFLAIERRVARPMLDLSLFRYPRFVGVQVLPIATCYGYVVLLVVLPLRLIGVDGRGELASGLAMVALSAPMLVVPFAAATLTRWLPAGVVSGAGLLIAAAGLGWLGTVPPGASMLGPMVVIGCGTGLPWGLMDGLSVSVVPVERAGMASGIFSTTRVAGEGIALAIVGAILVGLIESRLHGALPAAPAAPRIAQAAQRLAAGDLGAAASALPELAPPVLVRAYAGAFRTLTQILAAITAGAGLAVFALLGRSPRGR